MTTTASWSWVRQPVWVSVVVAVPVGLAVKLLSLPAGSPKGVNRPASLILRWTSKTL